MVVFGPALSQCALDSRDVATDRSSAPPISSAADTTHDRVLEPRSPSTAGDIAAGPATVAVSARTSILLRRAVFTDETTYISTRPASASRGDAWPAGERYLHANRYGHTTLTTQDACCEQRRATFRRFSALPCPGATRRAASSPLNGLGVSVGVTIRTRSRAPRRRGTVSNETMGLSLVSDAPRIATSVKADLKN
jgi:hypothetical protein